MKARVWLWIAVLASACTFGVPVAGADSFQFSGPFPLDAAANFGPLSSVACPSTSECTAVDHSTFAHAREVTFDPSTVTANSPSITAIDDTSRRIDSVSCPAAGECTAVDDEAMR